MIEIAKKNAPKAQFEVMDVRNLKFNKDIFDAIICFATLIHVNDNECIKILNKFDEIIKEDELIAINVMEWLDDKKEFFIDYFTNKNYEILACYDNPIFNSSKVKGNVADANQFSIIVKK